MKITCQACSAKYTIADDKVRGRKVKIRCKGCGTPIVVDGQTASAGDGLVGTPSMSDPPPAGAPLAESIPPPPQVPASTDVWNVNLTDTDSRTMTTAEIIAGWSSGLVTSDAFVWKDGMADWQPILDSAELAPRLGTPAAAAPTGTPYGPPVMLAPQVAAHAAAAAPAGFPQLEAKAPAGAARLSGQRSNTADLFGGVEAAGSEQEVVMSPHASALPTAPGSTAYGDDKLTGARNENSVLFSLDSLKAGFAGGSPAPAAGAPAKAPPKAPSGRSAQTSNPDDPFGMGSQGSMMGMASPGGNALFSLADNNALLTAPAPEPPPVVAVSHDLGGGSSLPASPAQKRKQMIMIGGIVAGVLIMGIVLGLALGGGDSEEAKNDGAASAKVGSDLVKEKAEEKKEEKKEEPKPEEKKEEPKPEEKAAESTAKADPGKKAGGGSAAPPKEKKEEAAAAPATDAPFSKASAISALSTAAAQAGGCKKPGGPTGAGKVQVTFAPSGRVTTANISGPPFAGTAVGGCIAGAFRRAKVPPFAGNPVTVQKSFSVN